MPEVYMDLNVLIIAQYFVEESVGVNMTGKTILIF